jgi:hypothetical protein
MGAAAPGIPCALFVFEGRERTLHPDTLCRGKVEACFLVIASEVKQSTFSLAAKWIASSLRSSQ